MELNAKEFVEAVKGKDASAYGAEYKKPSEEQKSAFAEREKTLRDCVPDEMKARPNWVAVKTWWNEAKGRVEKRPINCNTGDYAESDNPATWTSFENALKYARENGATTVAYALDGKDKKAQAFAVGELAAKKAAAKKITSVVFDRGGYLYTGRVAALADGARKGGLQF